MSEFSAVQNPMLKYAEQIGWARVTPEEASALRGGNTGLFFNSVLEDQLQRLNPGVVDAERTVEVIRRLRLLRPTIEGNRDMLLWLRGEMSVFVPQERRERNVTLLDFSNPANNVFQVTWEWVHKGQVYTNRGDAVFLINGIPVAVAETKAAGKPEGLAEGVEQVRRYHRETPEMLLAPQVFEVTQLLDFFYGATWNTSRKDLFNWKDDEPGNYEAKVKAFFDRARFLQVLKEYVLFLTKDDVLTKVILRQHQTRAVEKAVERVHDRSQRRGLIWHTQGSGKTLTMISIASRLLRETRGGEKPTVVMLVDRNELETQLFQNITAYGIGTARVAGSKRELQDILRSDYRGLVVSMIHKFDDIPAKINSRENVIVLVDEAHRTTGGDLGNYLMAALPNATYIGFTGTPVDRLSKGQGTFKVFGGGDERGYLDKYSIAESIVDGTTVPLNYALAPSDLRVDRETLEKRFLSLTEAEGLTDQEELNAVLDRAVELKEIMKAPSRIEGIAAFVARHFREVVRPMGFKAFLVAVDREACCLYKEALDRHLPPEMSRVVVSQAHNDPELLKSFYLDEAQEKQVRRSFTSKEKDPQILIVTEKLLTGFDAPILYCLYLDKPMRDHVLLQTIARVNRPYEDEEGQTKPYGFVLDFVGIFERLERALAFDSDVVASVIQNIDVLQALFETTMREQSPAYLRLTRGWDDKAKERAIEHFQDKDRRQQFYKFYRQVQTLYDILSPDAFLRPYIEDYQALTELYALIRQAYSPRVYVDKELTAKTRALLQSHTSLSDLDLPNKIHQLGPQELAALKGSDSSDTSKVLNLRKILTQVVDQQGGAKPFLLSIGERAEGLAQAYEDRQLTTQQVLAAFEKLAEEYIEADAERQRLDVDENTFAIYTVLKPHTSPESGGPLRPPDDRVSEERPSYSAGSDVTQQAVGLNRLFEQFPDFAWDATQARKLRTELYKQLRPLGGDKMIQVANAILKLTRV